MSFFDVPEKGSREEEIQIIEAAIKAEYEYNLNITHYNYYNMFDCFYKASTITSKGLKLSDKANDMLDKLWEMGSVDFENWLGKNNISYTLLQDFYQYQKDGFPITKSTYETTRTMLNEDKYIIEHLSENMGLYNNITNINIIKRGLNQMENENPELAQKYIPMFVDLLKAIENNEKYDKNNGKLY